MADSEEDALGFDQAPLEHIPKPWVFPVPEGTLQRVFGTSQVFRRVDDIKPKVVGLTVPLKVREYCHEGHQCLEQGDWETTVLLFSRALHLDSQLAEAYIQLCDFSSAAQNLQRAHSFQPEKASYLEHLTFVLYLQGQCLFEQGAFLDALQVFSKASALQPEKPCFRYRCVACLLALKRHHDCLSLVSKEVQCGTTNADVYILRARLHNFFQKPKLCYQDLHSALLLDPKHPQAKVLFQMMVDQAQQAHQDAGILAVQGKLQHALQRISSAIENNPLDPNLFLFRGSIYRRLQEFDAAVEDLLKALDMTTEGDMVQQAQRQLLLAYNDFAVHCYMQGAYQERVLLLNKALKDEQQEKSLYINSGDCFFQLGDLTFAEADYQQALALSPHDEGANLRMGMLQEKMGFCEQKGRQFQKAENHFSMAIQHNPQKAQYYLHGARSRHLLQNIFGAHQNVATVLLLDPKQPKLLPLMTSLFPGMSVKEVLSSQVAHLSRLQLHRVVESAAQASITQGIMGQLRKRELERQKARALPSSWTLGQTLSETSEEQKATPQALQAGPHHPEEEAHAPKEQEEEKEEKPELIPSKLRPLSDSYLDQTSSGSVLGFRTMPIPGTETSTVCQEYRRTSTTAVTFSGSSLLETQSSELGSDKDLSLWSTQSHRPSKVEAMQGHSHKSSRTEAAQSQSSSKTEAMKGQSWRPSKIKATQGPRQKPKTKAPQGPRQQLRRAKVAYGWGWGPSKADATQGLCWGLNRSSSKTSCDPSRRPSNSEVTRGQCQRPNVTQAVQSWSRSTSTGASKTTLTWGLRPES